MSFPFPVVQGGHGINLLPGYFLFAWGWNNYGQLGQNNTTATASDYSSPVQIGSEEIWSVVDGGYYNSYMIRNDRTLWAVGYNGNGELAQNDVTDRSSPVQIGADTYSAIAAAGYSGGYALKVDKTLWAWGYNQQGQLGQNDAGGGTQRSSPVQIGSATYTHIGSGGYLHAAIREDGTLHVCGYGIKGALAQNDAVSRSSPVQVGSDTYIDANAGNEHLLAIKDDGTLWGCGNNDFGQLGQGDTTDRSVLTQIGAATNWVKVWGGITTTFARASDGTIWACGRNVSGANGGALGDNTIVDKSSLVQIGALTTWTVLHGASSGGQAIRGGQLWGWGQQYYYPIVGDNTMVNRSSPVQVGALETWVSVRGNTHHRVALRS